MFCENPVQRVLWARNYRQRSNSLLLYAPEPALLLTDGEWLVLQTAEEALVVGADGVRIQETTDDYSKEPYMIEPADDMFGEAPETLLFADERLLSVDEDGKARRLVFDDFSVKLFSFESDEEFFAMSQPTYTPLRGFERHIRRACGCGGGAETVMDHVGDFVVRCARCRRSTYAGIYLRPCIDDWNTGKVPAVCGG